MQTSTDTGFPQHALGKSALLHVMPGVLTTIAFVALRPVLAQGGYPPLLAFLLAVLLVDIPCMLGIMLSEGRRNSGRFSLDSVLLYQDRLPRRTFALIFVGALVAVFLLTMAVSPLSNYLTEHLFAGLPRWFFLEEQTQYLAYPNQILVMVMAIQLVLTGVALPWVEELYFRGYLLPRISRFRAWAPLAGGLLFGLYHGWQPYSFPAVLLLGAALGYLVWWKRDLRLSIGLHVFANVMARLTFLMAALAM